MNEIVQSYIDQYGGKIGVLKYLWDYHAELRDNLAPMLVKQLSENVTGQEIISALGSCKETILRASHQDDWFGMVDFLPTEIFECNNKGGNCNNLIIQELEKLLGADHSNVIVSYSPYIEHILFTVTEHPNFDNQVYVDQGVTGNTLRNLHLFIEDRVIVQESSEDKSAKKVHGFYKQIRSLNIFSGDDKLQFEIGVTSGGHPYLFQVRKFSETFAPLSQEIQHILNNPSPHLSQRIMGNVPTEGTILKFCMCQRLDNIGDFIHISKDFIFASETYSKYPRFDPINFGKLNNNRFKGFLSDGHIGLYHNLTGPSQEVLKNGGFVILGNVLPESTVSNVTVNYNTRRGLIQFIEAT